MKIQSMQSLKQRLGIADRSVFTYYKHLWNRTHWYDYNTAQVITGDPGCGKTKFGVLSAFLINPKRFNENHYVNKAKEFLQAVDDGKTGDAIVWDEVGVSLSSRRWHSLSNILTAETLQTYRAKKLTVFFVVPDLSFVDVQARKLMTSYVEIKRYARDMTTNWIYNIIINRKKGEMYFSSYKLIIGGSLKRMRKLKVPRKMLDIVPKQIWRDIKERELKFKTSVRQKSLKTIRFLEKGDTDSTKTIFDFINDVTKDKDKFRNTKGKLDIYLIQTHLGIGRYKALQVKKFIEQKG